MLNRFIRFTFWTTHQFLLQICGILICFTIGFVIEPYIIPKIIGHITDLFYIIDKGNNLKVLHLYFMLYLITWLISVIFWFLGGVLNSRFYPSLEIKVRSKLFNNLHYLNNLFFLKNNAGQIANNISIFVDNLLLIFEFLFTRFLPGCLVFLIVFINFCLYNNTIGIILFIWIIGHFSISGFIYKYLNYEVIEHSKLHSQIHGFIIDSIKNYKIRKFFGCKNNDLNKLNILQQQEKTIYSRIVLKMNIARLIKGLNTIFWQGFLMNYILYKLWITNIIDTQSLITLIQMNGGIVILTWRISERIADFMYQVNKCVSVGKMMETDIKKKSKHKLIIQAPEGHIVIDKLSFAYEERIIFKNFSCDIPAGSLVYLVGESGSGKTTFINILANIIENYTGNIFFDNISKKQLSREFITQYITYVSSDNGLMSDTIANNLLIAKENASHKEIRESLEKASIWNFIQSLEGKENFMIDSGSNSLFSAGQEKRILIARAMMRKNASIVLLDELFNKLDSMNCKQIIKSINHYYSKSTILLADHELKLIHQSDFVIYFDKSEVIFSTYKDLLKKNKNFKHLIEFHKDYNEK